MVPASPAPLKAETERVAAPLASVLPAAAPKRVGLLARIADWFKSAPAQALAPPPAIARRNNARAAASERSAQRQNEQRPRTKGDSSRAQSGNRARNESAQARRDAPRGQDTRASRGSERNAQAGNRNKAPSADRPTPPPPSRPAPVTPPEHDARPAVATPISELRANDNATTSASTGAVPAPTGVAPNPTANPATEGTASETTRSRRRGRRGGRRRRRNEGGAIESAHPVADGDIVLDFDDEDGESAQVKAATPAQVSPETVTRPSAPAPQPAIPAPAAAVAVAASMQPFESRSSVPALESTREADLQPAAPSAQPVVAQSALDVRSEHVTVVPAAAPVEKVATVPESVPQPRAVLPVEPPSVQSAPAPAVAAAEKADATSAPSSPVPMVDNDRPFAAPSPRPVPSPSPPALSELSPLPPRPRLDQPSSVTPLPLHAHIGRALAELRAAEAVPAQPKPTPAETAHGEPASKDTAEPPSAA